VKLCDKMSNLILPGRTDRLLTAMSHYTVPTNTIFHNEETKTYSLLTPVNKCKIYVYLRVTSRPPHGNSHFHPPLQNLRLLRDAYRLNLNFCFFPQQTQHIHRFFPSSPLQPFPVEETRKTKKGGRDTGLREMFTAKWEKNVLRNY
jgi:hypothetical protein